MSIHVVVLSGGPGKRLWPLSNIKTPKPFLKLIDNEKTLLESTLEIASNFTNHVWLIGSNEYGRKLKSISTPYVSSDMLILEPIAKDTAAAISLAAYAVHHRDPQAKIVILPSDHFIPNTASFTSLLYTAVGALNDDNCLCIGIKPTGPETRYGYIIPGKKKENSQCSYISHFVEKPSRNVAQKLLDNSAYWNAGIIVSNVRTLINMIESHIPNTASFIAGLGDDYKNINKLYQVYSNIETGSFDSLVLQCSNNLIVLPTTLAWYDIGHWPELKSIEADKDGNFIRGNVTTLNTKNSVIFNSSKNDIVVAGINNATIVQNEFNTTLIANENQDIKQLLEHLEKNNKLPKSDSFDFFKKIMMPNIIYSKNCERIDKPWGFEFIWANTGEYVAKVLCVNAGNSLSKQYHEYKKETQFYLFGTGILEYNNKDINIVPGLIITINPGEIHRIKATTDICLFEVSTNHLDDVVRLEDEYGR